jgi:hypothetical protein
MWRIAPIYFLIQMAERFILQVSTMVGFLSVGKHPWLVRDGRIFCEQ